MGASGEKKEDRITWDYVLAVTEGGFHIFSLYLGKFPISRAFKHPLRNEKHPSAGIVCREGIWFLKDFSNTLPTMTAMQFVQRKFGLTFGEAIDKMCIDLGIVSSKKVYKPLEIIERAPEYVESEIYIGFSERKWIKKHYEFWENTGVTQEHCERYSTFAVKEAAINRRRIKIGETEVVWAYLSTDDKVKLYFPERPKGQRFKGNVSGSYLWGIEKIEKCGKLIVQKSMKDLLCTTVLFPCVIATQNESAAIFTDEVVDRIHDLSKNIFVAYGADNQGVEQSTKLSEKYKWKWINSPKFLLDEGINDFYGMSRRYGVESIRELLMNKGIL